MKYIDVRSMADEILNDVAAKMKTVSSPKKLLILYAGDNPASAAYMRGKVKDCQRCGIPCEVKKAQSFEELEWFLKIGNDIDGYGGAMIQLPLPDGWDESIVKRINPEKDVDGFVAGSRFKPCTPEGIVHIMHKELGDDLRGKRALIVGRGKLVGKPLGQMLQYDEGMSVMQVGSSEKDLDELVRGLEWSKWDAIVTATGVPGLVNLESCGAALVIDAGICRIGNSLAGDCYGFHEAPDNMRVTPVPGGVGPMTRAMLMRHMMEVQ